MLAPDEMKALQAYARTQLTGTAAPSPAVLRGLDVPTDRLQAEVVVPPPIVLPYGEAEELPLYLAVLAHSPEDTAIGTGRTRAEAERALVAAYPPAAGKSLDFVVLPLGQGVASLAESAKA